MAVTTSKQLRNKVIYQIFTRNYKEGTFKAVKADLSRIKALGVDIIYLMPVQPNGELHRKGSLGSPYAIKDYRAIDPRQGTMEDFIQLADAIHAKGMKLMLDVVYNHTSPDSWLAINHPEWFYHKADGSLGNRIGDWWDVVDLDYSQRELWEYQIETLKQWAKYVDGFRCDVAPLVPLEFWQAARRAVAELRPDCLWLAESVEHEFIAACRHNGIPAASDSELYQVFDICYDYDIYKYQSGVFSGSCTLTDYLHHVNIQEGIFPDNYSKLRCLENHDRPRAAALAPEERLLHSITAWIYFVKGTTMLYAGQEACDTHHPTLFDKDPIEFTGRDISAFLAKLSAIKKASIFTDSSFHAEAIGRHKDVIFAKYEANATENNGIKAAIGVFPTTSEYQSIRLDIPDGDYDNEINGEKLRVFQGVIACKCEPIIIFMY